MSCRQLGLMLFCVLACASAPRWGYAQSEDEPLPLLRGGFIQQLRSLPAELMKPLNGSEDGAEDLAPPQRGISRGAPAGRGNFSRRSTTHRSAPPRSEEESSDSARQSPWLDRLNPAARDNRVGDFFDPRSEDLPAPPEIDHTPPGKRSTGSDSAASSGHGGSIGSESELSNAHMRSQPRLSLSDRPAAAHRESQPSLKFEPHVAVPAPAARTFAEVTGERSAGLSLEQAPRVSRVPLPRPAPAASAPAAPQENAKPDEATSGEESPKRVPAIATSASPISGTMRISNAALQSTIEETVGESVRAPAELSEATRTERRSEAAAAEGAGANNPSADTSRPEAALDSENKDQEKDSADVLALPELPSAPSASALPQLPTAHDSRAVEAPDASNNELRLPVPSDPTALDAELPSGPTPASPGLTAGLPSLPSLPALTVQSNAVSQSANSGPSDTAASPHGATSPAANPQPFASQRPASVPSQMPKLVTDNRRQPSQLDDPATADQRLKMEAPHVQVILRGPSDMPIGSPALYEIAVRNTDTIDLQGLILRLDIPADIQVQALRPTHGQFEVEKAPDGLTMLTWGFDHLAAGMTAIAPMQLTATSAKNFAVAMEWTLMPIAGNSPLEVTAPRLELALEGPAEVTFGNPNVYRLHVRNPGSAAANGVTVQLSAEPYGSSAAEIARIEPGEEEVIDVELTFNERGSIPIRAHAKDSSGLSSQTEISVLVRQAKLQSRLSATPAVYHGSPTECRVRLLNSGDAAATQLQARLQLPNGASLLSAPTGASLVGRELTWPIAEMATGKTEEFLLQLMLTEEGENQLEFTCSGAGQLHTSAHASTRVEAITDLKLVVNDPVAPAPVGSDVVYELRLTNRGTKAATNVKVIAQFSEGIEPIRGEGQPARVIPGQALFEPIDRIDAGETLHLKVIAQAAASGTHRFRVEVRSDETNVRLVQEESTQYLEGASRLATPPARSTLR